MSNSIKISSTKIYKKKNLCKNIVYMYVKVGSMLNENINKSKIW